MKTNSKSRGTWIHRFAIRLFTVVLAVLVFWVLGFFVEDIRSIRGHDYDAIEKEQLDKNLVEKRAVLDMQISELTRQDEGPTTARRLGMA
jgi:hypothetical protein